MAGTQNIVALLVLCILAIILLSRPDQKLHEPFLASTPVSETTLAEINNAVPYLVIAEFMNVFNTTKFPVNSSVKRVCGPHFETVKTNIANTMSAKYKDLSEVTRAVLNSSADEMRTVLQKFIVDKHCLAKESNNPAIEQVTALRTDLVALQKQFEPGSAGTART